MTPVVMVLRLPIRRAIFGAMVDIGIITTIIGRSAAAEVSAVQPSTAWK
jgi:hypothetical protein